MQRHGNQSRRSVLTAAVLATLCSVSGSRGAELYWDANGATAGTGGTGNWGAVNTWRSGSSGGALGNWVDGNGAVFGGTAGTVTVNIPVSATGLTFQIDGYTLANATNVITLTGTPVILLDSSAANTAVLNVPVSSAVPVSFQRQAAATGQQVIQFNRAATFSGGITLDSDVLRVNVHNNGNLGSGAGAGTVTINGNQCAIATAGATSGTRTLGNTFLLNPLNAPDFSTAFGPQGQTAILDIAGQITGNADIVIGSRADQTGTNGNGITIFNNATNDYTGSTTILNTDSGVFRIGVAGALPTGTALIFGKGNAGSTNNVGAVDMFGNDISISSLSTNLGGTTTARGITNSNAGAGGTISITGASSAVFAGQIGNFSTVSPNVTPTNNLALHLTSSHSGSLNLTNINDYAGATTIDGGTLILGHTATAANTIVSNTTVNSGGTLASAAGTQATIGSTGGSVTVNSGRISPGTDGGIGTLVAASLAANTSSTYQFDLSSGSDYDVLSLGGALTLDAGAHTIDVATTIPIDSSFIGSYTLVNSASRSGSFTLGATPGGSFTYTLDQTSPTAVVLTIGSVNPSLVWDIGGSGAPIVEGAGTWSDGSTDFTDVASNTGATFNNANSFDVRFGDDSLGSGDVITLGSNVRVGGKLVFGRINSAAPYQIGAIGGTNTLTTSANGISCSVAGVIEAPLVMEASQTWAAGTGATLTVNGVVSEIGGAATLTKSGSGTVVLNNANAYTGGTNITDGTLAIGNGGALGSGPVSISNNATLRATADVTVPNSLSIDAGGGTISVDPTFTTTLSGNIAGAGGLTATGGGTLALTGTNTFNGLTLTGGGTILIVSAESALGSGNMTMSNFSILRAAADFSITKDITLGGNTGRFDTNGFTVTLSGTISGPGSLTKEGAGTVVITGDNSYSGNTQFPAITGGGTIETLHLNALGGPSANNFLVLNDGTLRTTADLSLNAVRGTHVLTKEGAGKLIVSGTSNAMNLNAGASLVVNQGSVQMNSLTGLGGNNNVAASQMPITLNAGTELMINWSSGSDSRLSRNITLNDATLTRLNGATGSDVSELTTYTGATDLGGVLTVTGSSTIRNQEIAVGAHNKQLQIHMPVVVSTGGTLTLSSANNTGDYHGHRTILRGVADAGVFPNDAVTLQAGSTIVTSGAGEKAIGDFNTAGKPIVGQGASGSEAMLKLDSHTFLNDVTSGSASITRLVVAGSADAGLRIEAPMNATYTTPDGGGAPLLRTYDGTTGFFGINTTSTQEGGTPPTGYSVIGNAYTVMSPKRYNQLSDSFGAVTLGGTLTLAATDPAGATGTIDNGPTAPTAITLALDNAATSGDLVYTILPSANGGNISNFAGLRVQRSNLAAGTVTARIDPDSTASGVLRMASVEVSNARLDLTNNKLVTQSPRGSWDGSAYTGIEGLVQSGRGNGTWNGNGIVTSLTDATASVLTSLAVSTGADLFGLGPTDTQLWAGQTINGDSTLVMYTWGGDAQLDGDLDGDDYFQIDSNVAQSGSVFGYDNGDFNYDGLINGDDYFIIDSNIAFAQTQPNWPTSSGVAGMAAVPEPATLGLFALFAGALSRRRRCGR